MTIEAILFDLWGTLIVDPPERSRPRQVWRALNVQRILAEHTLDLDFTRIDEALVAASTTLMSLHERGIDVRASGRVNLFLLHLDEPPAADLSRQARNDIEAAITAMQLDLAPLLAENALETLIAVKSLGLRTALVSNAGFTTAPHLGSLLDDFGLTPHLDALVFSDDLHLAKPDPRIFQHALEAASATPGTAVFVGDAPHNDIYGAQSAGIFAVQIGRHQRDGVKPQAQIDNLDELIPALRGYGLLSDAVAQDAAHFEGSRT